MMFPLDILRRITFAGDAVKDCWFPKTKWHDGKGYRKWRVEGVVWYVHRYVYEVFVWKIEEGMELDHQCRNRGCCNPWHLEQVTPTENKYRRYI